MQVVVMYASYIVVIIRSSNTLGQCCYFAVLSMVIGLSGCGGLAEKSISNVITQSALYLPNDTLRSAYGDMEKLYEKWLRPHITHKNRFIISTSPEQFLMDQQAIVEGISRFCRASGGNITDAPYRYGVIYRCVRATDNAFIGKLDIERYKGNLLKVTYDSASRLKRRKKEQKTFDDKQRVNGPTGTVVTNRGKFEFIRIGNLRKRHQIEVELVGKPTTSIPIEQVSSIIANKNSNCNLIVNFKGGRSEVVNVVRLQRKASPNCYAYDIHLSMVLIDKKTKQPYTRKLSFFDEIKSITIDSDQNKWKSFSGSEIKSSFQISSLMPAYKNELKIRANRLMAEANRDGWISLIHKGESAFGKISPKMVQYLRSRLDGSFCRYDNTVAEGFTENTLKCKTAAHELNLVSQGYTLSADIMPLATIIILEKMKQDITLD